MHIFIKYSPSDETFFGLFSRSGNKNETVSQICGDKIFLTLVATPGDTTGLLLIDIVNSRALNPVLIT